MKKSLKKVLTNEKRFDKIVFADTEKQLHEKQTTTVKSTEFPRRKRH